MMLSFDEFASNFDDVSLDQSAQTPGKSTSHLSPTHAMTKDTDNTDILSRVDKLEVVMNDIRTTIHGGDDGETTRPTGILSHLSVLENSFNEGKQKLVSVEHRMQDINARHVGLVNEVRTKATKEDQKKDMKEDVAVTERFKNLEEKVQGTISDNNACKERLTCVEGELKSVKSVNLIHNDQKKELENIAVSERFKNLEEKVQGTISDNKACKQRIISVEDELKSVKTNEDQKKEQIQKLEGKVQETISANEQRIISVEDELKRVNTNEDQKKEQIQKLEVKVQETISDTNVYNQRLTSVEDQLKSVKSVDDTKKTEEMNNLKRQVTTLDKFTKTQILERLSFLENRPKVSFSVDVKHDVPWTTGTVIRDVCGVWINEGNAFEGDKCWFLVPVDGVYGMILWLSVAYGFKTCVQLWSCEVVGGGWRETICNVTAEGDVNGGKNGDVNLVYLKKGQALRARVFGGIAFEGCEIYGWLVSAFSC